MSTKYYSWVFFAILFFGIIAGIFNYRKKIVIRPVVLLFAVTFFAEILSYYTGKYYRNNMPVAHIFNPIQLSVWGYFFYKNFSNIKAKKIIKWVTIAMILFSIFNTLFIQPIKTFPDNFIKLETMLLIISGAYLFIQQLELPSGINIFKEPVFVTSVAILWFNLLSFLFFLLLAYMIANKISTVNMRVLHFFSNYVYYVLLIVTFFLPNRFPAHARKIQ